MATDSRPSTKYESPAAATLTALRDMIRPRRDIDEVGPEHRLDGHHVVITGASQGLGRATAHALAARGATLTVVGRRPPDALAEELRQVSGQPCRALGCELSDLDEVRTLADRLAGGAPVNTLILNAGMMVNATCLTAQGFEEMFAVHFAANVVLLSRLRATETLASPDGATPPALIVVSSEAHRSAPDTSLESFEEPPRFGMRDGLKWYGHSKFLMLAYSLGLARTQTADSEGLAVHTLCPGPIASSIAREAPAWVRPLAGSAMRLLFNSPEKAACPVVYFACSPDAAGTTGDYLHMRARKTPDPRVLEAAVQDQITARAAELFAPWLG